MQVYYDFTFDRGYTDADKIVQFNIFYGEEAGISRQINFQLPAQISDRLPEMEAYCMVSTGMAANWGEESFDVDREDDNVLKTHSVKHIRTTQGFWSVFSPEILSGDTTGIFSAPGSAMISEKTAQRLFGSENPVGKSIRYHYGNSQLTIQAIYRDFPKLSVRQWRLYLFA
jgi:putative ABC transport system permease protein